MKLTTATLPNFFTIASPNNSHYTTATNCFDFVDRSSDSLVVTVGDSWTWGAGLDPCTRLQEVYGNLVAKSLSADFLNLGQSGSNNFFIAERVEELGKIVDRLGYKTVYLICTFTETGRSFNSHHDVYLDYVKWFGENDINDFLYFLNNECYNRIQTVVQQHHINLRMGTNFVDPIGYPADVMPWFRQLGINCPVTACVGATGALRLQTAVEFVQDQQQFKRWFSNLVQDSVYIDNVCQSDVLFKSHPYAVGHAVYATSLLKSINE